MPTSKAVTTAQIVSTMKRGENGSSSVSIEPSAKLFLPAGSLVQPVRQAHTIYGRALADVTTGVRNICAFFRALLQCSVTVRQPPFRAPTLEPTTMSAAMPWRASECSMPTWMAPETAAAGKHKGGLRRTDLVAHRHAPTPSSSRRQQAARRWGGYSSGRLGWATGAQSPSERSPDGAKRNPGISLSTVRDTRISLRSIRATDATERQRSTNAFSITKWPGVLSLPSMKPPDSNICFSSSSIPGLPHIMTRSVSILSGAW